MRRERADTHSGRPPRGGRLSFAAVLARLAALLAALQLARWRLESLVFLAVPRTPLSDELVRAAVLLVLLAVVVAAAGPEGRARLRLLPERLGAGYRAALAGTAALLLATPPLTGQAADPAAWAGLACSAVATPLFEETLFRGLVWARLEDAAADRPRPGPTVVVASAALFGLWHLGYADAVAWQFAAAGEAAGAWAVAGELGAKAIAGALVGLALGVLRRRLGCVLAPALFHAFWNLLA